MSGWFGRRRNRSVGESGENVAASQQVFGIDVQEMLAAARNFRLFIMAPTFDETFRLLREHQEVLTSENTLMACNSLIAQLQHSGETEQAVEVERRMNLLEAAQQFGVEEAWRRFLMMTFLEAPNWYEARRILDENQSFLLSDKAITFLRQMIDGLRFNPDDVELVRGMEQSLQILEEAKSLGTDKAWEKFADRRFQEALKRVPDPHMMRNFLFLYEKDPDEFARQMGARRDDPVLVRLIEHFRKIV